MAAQRPGPGRKRTRLDPAKLNLADITGEENVAVINRETNKRITGAKAPPLKHLVQWLDKNPAFDVDSKWAHIVHAKVGSQQLAGFGKVSRYEFKHKASSIVFFITIVIGLLWSHVIWLSWHLGNFSAVFWSYIDYSIIHSLIVRRKGKLNDNLLIGFLITMFKLGMMFDVFRVRFLKTCRNAS